MAQQRKPAFERHRHARRILARRRDVDQRRRRAARALVDVETMRIDRHGLDTRARHGQCGAQIGKAWILDPHGVRRFEHHPRNEVDRLHRAVEDHDPPGIAVDASGRNQVSRRCLAQRCVAQRREIAEQATATDAKAPRSQSPPQHQRERIERGHSRQKRHRLWNAGRKIGTRRAAPPRRHGRERLATQHTGPPPLRACGPRDARPRRDKGAGADAANEKPLGLQSREGVVDGVARDAPVQCQLPRGRQARAVRQAAVDNRGETGLVDLLAQAQALRGRPGKEREHGAAGLLAHRRLAGSRPQGTPTWACSGAR